MATFTVKTALRILPVAATLVLAGQAQAQRPAAAWTADTLDGWSTAGDPVPVTARDGSLVIGFAAQTTPKPERVSIQRSVGSGLFVTRVRLRVRAVTRAASSLRVALHTGRGGATWGINVDPPPVGEWREVSIPVSYEAGWRRGPGSTAAGFFNDALTVDRFVLTAVRSGAGAAHELLLDEVLLEGLGTAEVTPPETDGDGDGLTDVWEDRFGFGVSDGTDGERDPDGDGMTNRAEFRAGTDPVDAGSRLAVRVTAADVRQPVDRIMLEWPSVAGRSYSVGAARDLRRGFTPLAEGIQATPPTNRLSVYVRFFDRHRFFVVGVED